MDGVKNHRNSLSIGDQRKVPRKGGKSAETNIERAALAVMSNKPTREIIM